ncbi:MAG TPA: hypothetical protein PLV70_00355 [Flavobacteriales bacterium]|nr:hypothetical protein [Flavobacteriales bacterium]HRO38516.1 hypothetical protein [Flavobacteriales bacterium]HRP80900.1 hypothetical protein [Flavobacteriales bacterium]HRQ83543.1 hypothetical protein [Flavobacteriales bacterium]
MRWFTLFAACMLAVLLQAQGTPMGKSTVGTVQPQQVEVNADLIPVHNISDIPSVGKQAVPNTSDATATPQTLEVVGDLIPFTQMPRFATLKKQASNGDGSPSSPATIELPPVDLIFLRTAPFE